MTIWLFLPQKGVFSGQNSSCIEMHRIASNCNCAFLHTCAKLVPFDRFGAALGKICAFDRFGAHFCKFVHCERFGRFWCAFVPTFCSKQFSVATSYLGQQRPSSTPVCVVSSCLRVGRRHWIQTLVAFCPSQSGAGSSGGANNAHDGTGTFAGGGSSGGANSAHGDSLLVLVTTFASVHG